MSKNTTEGRILTHIHPKVKFMALGLELKLGLRLRFRFYVGS